MNRRLQPYIYLCADFLKSELPLAEFRGTFLRNFRADGTRWFPDELEALTPLRETLEITGDEDEALVREATQLALRSLLLVDEPHAIDVIAPRLTSLPVVRLVLISLVALYFLLNLFKPKDSVAPTSIRAGR